MLRRVYSLFRRAVRPRRLVAHCPVCGVCDECDLYCCVDCGPACNCELDCGGCLEAGL